MLFLCHFIIILFYVIFICFFYLNTYFLLLIFIYCYFTWERVNWCSYKDLRLLYGNNSYVFPMFHVLVRIASFDFECDFTKQLNRFPSYKTLMKMAEKTTLKYHNKLKKAFERAGWPGDQFQPPNAKVRDLTPALGNASVRTRILYRWMYKQHPEALFQRRQRIGLGGETTAVFASLAESNWRNIGINKMLRNGDSSLMLAFYCPHLFITYEWRLCYTQSPSE